MSTLARVAENLYWMARYLERAENTARLVDVNSSLLLDLPQHARPGWASLIAITGCDALFGASNAQPDEAHVVKFMLADGDNPGSILSSCRWARENARSVRDIIPREAWEQINELFLHAQSQVSEGLSAKRRFSFLNEIILRVQQIVGVLAGGMSHDDGYEFMTIGLNLERADMTTRIIDVQSSNLAHPALRPFENILWMSVLKSLTAYQMYRRHMQAAVKSDDVLKFLLQNRQFPRSFYFCLSDVAACLQRLPRSAPVLGVLLPLKQMIDQAQPELLEQEALTRFIDELQIELGRIHDVIYANYFGTAVDVHQKNASVSTQHQSA
ncbi:alpha-E domain-containing protein [Candidatus Methylospira mobilis]|uniref:Alpha-E domain-containing protein n=1 Tax=Candidatus Methylospira mobilis TaxID=1808979 RepID=A0A5Q0BHB6_9GAMM|nr:alpha-E domain-containing protein [Candidatus Methylospira mobilis]QFY43220.1 alpha-E domain-containing protein [Candidatus Methylospira mobilis]WNV03574.1 alpha-E domain-containing protein [Candidatus Methylospira mobilis]